MAQSVRLPPIKETSMLIRPVFRRLLDLASAALCVLAVSGVAEAGTLSTLYDFTDGADGANAIGGVVADSSGTLYGETAIGGAAGCVAVGRPKNGCGTLYSFSTTGGLKVLVSFLGANGAYGQTTPTLSGTTLYGATNAGGSGGAGVVFSVRTDGTAFTLLHQFSGTDGRYPAGILRLGPGKTLYGLTSEGGTSNFGVLFSIKPDGTFAVLHNFTGSPDGRRPLTLLISQYGTLIGSTNQGGANGKNCSFGCGTIFEYSPSSGVYSIPYLFQGNGYNGGFVGDLGPGSTVYGNDVYSPFSLNTATGLVNYGSFATTATSGTVGSGPLLAPGGTLIGVNGDSGFTSGVLYSSTIGVITPLAFFGDDGTNPQAQPILMPSGQIIGTTTENGDCRSCGSIWEYTP